MTGAQIYNLPADAKTRDNLLMLARHLAGHSEHVRIDHPTTWFIPVQWEALDVNPQSEADAFVANVFRFLKETYGARNHNANALTYTGSPLKSAVVYCVDKAVANSKLSLVHYNDLLYAFISGSDGSPDDNSVRPWAEALEYAEGKRSEEHPTHEWWAVVGLADPPFSGTHPKLQNGNISVGQFSLEGCDFRYEERRPLPSLNSWETFLWAPVVVRGRNHGYNWNAAEILALKDIHRLCELLSLETGCYWSLKESPRQASERSPVFPDETPLGLIKRPGETDDSPSGCTPTIDSDRISRMWDRCKRSPDLAGPVEAYYEALSLRKSHPSFALVGFVAVFEEAGKRLLVDQPTSERCPTCNKERTSGSKERFKRALRLVLPEDKIECVSSDLYKWRSKTAHSGRTLGWESSFGRSKMGDSLLVRPSEFKFSVDGPLQADELARTLLLRVMTD